MSLMSYRRRFFRLGSSLPGLALGTTLAAGVLSLAAPAEAQQAAFRFPSRAETEGFRTDVLTSYELQAQYTFWRSTFIERCPQGDARMVYPESDGDTRSEGVGYGMVIAAYFGDKETFDGLWNYYQRSSPGTGLMHWRRDGCNAGGGGGDTGSASDADIDAAFGLIVADRQWPGEDYAGDAASIVGAIRTQLFQNGCQGILLAGTQFAACGCINPSYIPPGYYPAFGEYEQGQAQFWNTARTNSYTYFNAASNNNTGLVPAWSQSNGNTPEQCPGQPQVSGGGNTNEFQADAARTPWRVATDYIWSGNASASSFLTAIANFATSQPIVHIVDRYSLGGQALNGNGDATGFRSTFTMGGFATAMTASSQVNLDRFTGAWQSMYLPGDNIGANGAAPRAFNSSLALLYGLVVTGYMWDPLGPNPTFQAPAPLTPAGGSNQIENGDFEEGMLGWSFANLSDPATPGTPAEGFAMHRNGEMNIEIQRAAARAQDAFEIRMSQGVTLQAGQKYRMSVRARAAEPRPFTITVGLDQPPYTVFAELINRRGAGPIALTTEMLEYDTVFTAAASNNAARFNIDVGTSDVELVIDDVIFEDTDLPVTTPGDLIGLEPPVTDPNNPSDPGNPNAPGGGGAGNDPGTIGNVNNPGNDNGGPGVGPGVNPATPPPPAQGLPPNVGACTTDADCPGYLCSLDLNLCYEPTYGYVWSQAQQAWTFPPNGPCGTDYVFWPLVRACYDPETGYAFDPTTMQWVFVGDNYTEGLDADDAPEDSGCSVQGAGSASRAGWVVIALGALAAAGLRRRRRAS